MDYSIKLTNKKYSINLQKKNFGIKTYKKNFTVNLQKVLYLTTIIRYSQINGSFIPQNGGYVF